MKKLLILGASEFQIPLIIQAKKMNILVCVVDINPYAPGFEYADKHIVCSIKDDKKILEIAQEFQPDGITVGMCDVAVLTAALVCNKLGLPNLNVDTARKATDKFLMIETFEKYNVPHPFFMYLNDKTSLDGITVPFPAISKPTDMAGSRGINYIKDESELKTAITDSLENSDKQEILLEEYMIGPEVSVEIVVKDFQPYVLQITDKLTSGIPHFFEVGHSQPSILGNDIKDKIEEVACMAVKSLELNNCIAHAEIIVTEDGPKMVEIGARMGGDGIHQYLLQYSTGINLSKVAIDIALGNKFEVPLETIHEAAVIRFIPSRCGKIKSVDNKIEYIDGLKKIKIYCQDGDYFSDASDNSGRFGYVISQANSMDKAIEICEKAIKKISIEVDDGEL